MCLNCVYADSDQILVAFEASSGRRNNRWLAGVLDRCRVFFVALNQLKGSANRFVYRDLGPIPQFALRLQHRSVHSGTNSTSSRSL